MAPGAKHSAVAAPDGGWGWMIVAGCFITTICTRAVTRCISIFFVEFHMHFSSEYSRTAWIHSLVDCTTMLCAPLGSYIGNRLSCRVAVMVGGLLSSVGLILSSFASSLEYLYLSLGILTGVGFALCYTPAVAMVGTYFSERKALAYGIAMSGSGIGTFVLAPVVQLLIEHYSWRGALLILGGVVSHLCVCGALMRPLDSHCEKRDCKDREEELSMLNTKLAGAKLHMELNLDEATAAQENLEQAKLDCSAVNIDRVSTEEITQNEEQEQAQCLLRNTEQFDLAEITDLNQADGKSVASDLRDGVLDEKTCGEHSKEDPVVTDTSLKENLKNTDLNPGHTKVISANATSKDFKQDTNSKPTNLKGPTASDQRSRLGTSLSATVPAESELNDSKLASESELAESKLAESKLLCEMALWKCPGFPIKTEAPGENKEKEGCFFLSATEEYSFLLIPDFLLLSVSFLFLAFGCSVPFVYLVSYSLSIGVSHQQAALLMSVLGVMGIVGNITFGWISDRQCLRAYRRVSYLLAVGLEGLGCLFVPLLRSFSLLVPFSLFYGYFDGAYVALLPVVTSDIVGPTHLSSALGVVCFLHAVPYLISPPIAGWLVDQTGSYTAAFLLCGFSLICSALILATVTLARRCSKGSSPSLLPRIKPSRS